MCMYVRAVPTAAGMGTSAGLLLGTECVALVAQAGVGAGQVPAARLPAGIRICTFIYVCEQPRDHRCVQIDREDAAGLGHQC